MSQIYESKYVAPTPTAVNFSTAAQIAGSSESVGTQLKKEGAAMKKEATAAEKQIDKQKQTYLNTQVSNGKQAMSQAYELYKDDPEEFQKASDKIITDTSREIATDEEKLAYQTNMQLVKGVYSAKVQNAFKAKQNNLYVTGQRVKFEQDMSDYMNNASLLGQGGEEAQLLATGIKSTYDNRFAVDEDGKPIYTLSQINKIEAFVDDIGYYALMGEVQDNPEKADDFYNMAINQPKEFKEKYKMTNEKYDKVVSGLDTVRKRATKDTADEVVNTELIKADIYANYKAFDYDNGVKKNKKVNSDEITGLYSQLKSMQASYTTKADATRFANMQLNLSKDITEKGIKDGKRLNVNGDIDDYMYSRFSVLSGMVDNKNYSTVTQTIYADLDTIVRSQLIALGIKPNARTDKNAINMVNEAVKGYIRQNYTNIPSGANLNDKGTQDYYMEQIRKERRAKNINKLYGAN